MDSEILMFIEFSVWIYLNPAA